MKNMTRGKNNILLTVLCVTFLTALLVPDIQGALEWRSEWADTDWLTGRHTSIALDSMDRPHISYQDFYQHETDYPDLKHAMWNGTAWETETVDATGDVGYHTSIAIGASDYPQISYYDNTNGDLKLARWDGTQWNTEIVDSTGDVGEYCSLALDSNGYPHISYYDASNGDLKYAYFEKPPGEWVYTTVDTTSNTGLWTSLALDSWDRPHISYYSSTGGNLMYANLTGLTWFVETVDTTGDVGKYCSLVLQGNTPHISYYYAKAVGYPDLKYAKRIGSTWTTETVPEPGGNDWDLGKYSSLVLDSQGYPHISYYDDTHNDLWYAGWNGTDWIVDHITEGWADAQGEYSSIALDSSDNLHISCYDDIEYTGSIRGHLLYVTNAPVRDGAITSIVTSKTGCLPLETVGQGQPVVVNVTVENQGDLSETITVTAYANATMIGGLSRLRGTQQVGLEACTS
jgi:hypothetical protein